MMKVFKRAAAEPKGTGSAGFLAAVLHERQDLQEALEKGEISAYSPLQQGELAQTLVIGAEVFKASRAENMICLINNEADILRQMEGKGLPVPKVTCAGRDFPFFGMTRVPGVMLGRDFRDRLSDDEKRLLAQDLIDFTIRMAKAFPVREDGAFMMHDDLHTGNILIDPVTKRLSGIIDFGRVEYRQNNFKDGGWYYHRDMGESFGGLMQAEFMRRQSEIRVSPQVRQNNTQRMRA